MDVLVLCLVLCAGALFVCHRFTNMNCCGLNTPLSSTQMTYSTPDGETSCWSASLTLPQYRAFASSSYSGDPSTTASPFFAAAPVPQLAKFGPGLLVCMHCSQRAATTSKTPSSSLPSSLLLMEKDFVEPDATNGSEGALTVSSHVFADSIGGGSGIRIELHDGVNSLLHEEVREGYFFCINLLHLLLTLSRVSTTFCLAHARGEREHEHCPYELSVSRSYYCPIAKCAPNYPQVTKKWTRDAFGLDGNTTHAILPYSAAAGGKRAGDKGNRVITTRWVYAQRAAASHVCSSLVEVAVRNEGLGDGVYDSAHLDIVVTKKKASEEAHEATEDYSNVAEIAAAVKHEHCALLAMTYLASQPEVKMQLKHLSILILASLRFILFHVPIAS